MSNHVSSIIDYLTGTGLISSDNFYVPNGLVMGPVYKQTHLDEQLSDFTTSAHTKHEEQGNY